MSRPRFKLRYMIYATAPDERPRSFNRTTKKGATIYASFVLTRRLSTAVRKAAALAREGCTGITIERHTRRRAGGHRYWWVANEWGYRS